MTYPKNRKCRHGHAKRSSVTTGTYNSWKAMRRRCDDENYPHYRNYGGRGITYSERWKTFELFLEDMGIRPEGGTLERLENDSGYFPWNCRWATRKAQAYNRRSNVRLEIDGETKTAKEWATQSGITYNTVMYRLRHGWEPKAAVFCPPGGQRGGGEC